MDRAETGRTGEAVVARYYQKQGCELVAHNYRTIYLTIRLNVK